MASLVYFRVDPRLASILGDTYSNVERALKELVDNAWDADATSVEISIPEPPSTEPIVIADNGSGMTAAELESEYLVVARDRRNRRGNKTPSGRAVKGRKGIGKFAGLMIAQRMRLSATARGETTSFTLEKPQLASFQSDLEKLPIEVERTPSPTHQSGTRIALDNLNQNFRYPSETRLGELLLREYGREPDFVIIINGTELAASVLPGTSSRYAAILPNAGPVELTLTICERPMTKALAGIAVRVGGKIIGTPSTFGLEDDPEIPAKLLPRIYGDVAAEQMEPYVTADGSIFVDGSNAFRELSDWISGIVKKELESVCQAELQLARARIRKDILRRLEALPEHRRAAATRHIERVLRRLYGEAQERIDAVISLGLDAMEKDEYWAIFQHLDAIDSSNASLLAEALADFGLADMAIIGKQAQGRLEFLQHLDALIQNPDTEEKEIHKALVGNLWVLGREYAFIASNETLKTTLERYTSSKYSGPRAKKRPDLFLGQDLTDRHLLIEFKRPSKSITRDDEAQAQKYRDDLSATFQGIHVLLLGQKRASGALPGHDAPGLRVLSYASLISSARRELEWLLKGLSQS